MVSLQTPPSGVEPMSKMDFSRLTGSWFEIGRLENDAEADYGQAKLMVSSLSESQVQIKLTDSKNAARQWEAGGSYDAKEAPATFLLSCAPLIRCGFHVIAIDQDHQDWMLVTGHSRDQLWVFSRHPGVDAKILQRLMSQAEDLGYDPSQMIINNLTPAVLKEPVKVSPSDQPSQEVIYPAAPLPETPANEPPAPLHIPEIPSEIPPSPKNIPTVPKDIPPFGQEPIKTYGEDQNPKEE